MKTRVITALIGTAVILPILWFSDTWAFPIAVVFATVLGVWEYLHCIGQHKNVALSAPLYLCAAAGPVGVRLLTLGVLSAKVFIAAAFCLSALVLAFVFGLVVFRKETGGFLEYFSSYLMCAYTVVGFSCLVAVRDMIGGEYLYMGVFVAAWITDIFAYFSGRLFGKHKLCPAVSPKKTVEGSIGGILFCTLGFLLLGLLARWWGHYEVHLWLFPVIGLILSVISQIGDLILSVVKRHYGIKDYGWLLPGHGGILDRCDSLLAVSLVCGAVLILLGAFGVRLLV